MISRKNRKALHDAKRVAREHYAWPGGYPLFLVTTDNGALCPKCCRKEYRQIVCSAINDYRDGWQPACAAINYEDPDLYCDHCGTQIESAYAEPEETDENATA